MQKSWARGLVAALCAGIAMSAGAAETVYPQRAIRLIIPQAPGGGSDTIGRYMAQKLGDSLGQQIVVDNRPGAAGMLGAELVKQATPDGYTMLLCAIDTITAPIVSTRAPFDAVRDFSPITQLTLSPNVWLVAPSFAAQSMKMAENLFINPGTVPYGEYATPLMKVAVISNCPRKYNPACGYNPSPVSVELYSPQRSRARR
jgi:tripartite-type tricarboxylate transporter receptor subunit TctC